MNISDIINKTILQYLNEEKTSKETIEGFIDRFKLENNNPKFLENHLKIPNFRLELTHDNNVKIKKYNRALPNKCETNTFNFIKDMVKINNHRYYPVSGWAFLESTTYFEHFWVYDGIEDNFLDITPMGKELPYAYGGVINFNINDDILNAEQYNEIPFLLGKVGHSLYSKHQKNKTLPIMKKKNLDVFSFINKSEKYEDLSKFINDNNIESVEELKHFLIILENKRNAVRNNNEWDYYSNLIQQIENLDL